MSTPPLKPVAPPTPAAPVSGSRDTNIVVIPESYYGVAVTMQPPFASDEEAKTNEPPPSPPPPVKPVAPPPAPPVVQPPVAAHRSRLWLIGLVFFVLLAAGGAWVYWNRALLFGPAPTPLVVVEKPAAPNAPTELVTVSPGPGSVRLNWQDHSETEDGFRIERKTALEVEFVPLQTLPANSLTFLDQNAPAGAQATYRVLAFNVGGDSAASNMSDIAVTALPIAPPPAPTLPPDGLDSDSDGLTDTEEVAYGTSPQLPDTDRDGYLDGNEVFNLYAPTVPAPATLLSLPIMKIASSTIGWQTLIPRSWIVETASSTNDVRFVIPSGETFVVRIEENPQKQDIRTWLGAQKALRPEQIIELTSNKYHVPFYLGSDRLTAYIPWENRVLAVTYQLGSQTFVNMRTSFGMMLNALRLTGSPNVPDLSQSMPIPAAFQTSGTTSSLVAPPSSTVATSSTAATTSSTIDQP